MGNIRPIINGKTTSLPRKCYIGVNGTAKLVKRIYYGTPDNKSVLVFGSAIYKYVNYPFQLKFYNPPIDAKAFATSIYDAGGAYVYYPHYAFIDPTSNYYSANAGPDTRDEVGFVTDVSFNLKTIMFCDDSRYSRGTSEITYFKDGEWHNLEPNLVVDHGVKHCCVLPTMLENINGVKFRELTREPSPTSVGTSNYMELGRVLFTDADFSVVDEYCAPDDDIFVKMGFKSSPRFKQVITIPKLDCEWTAFSDSIYDGGYLPANIITTSGYGWCSALAINSCFVGVIGDTSITLNRITFKLSADVASVDFTVKYRKEGKWYEVETVAGAQSHQLFDKTLGPIDNVDGVIVVFTSIVSYATMNNFSIS